MRGIRGAWAVAVAMACGCAMVLGVNPDDYRLVCAPGERRCDGNTAQSCGENGLWKDESVCAMCINGVCIGGQGGQGGTMGNGTGGSTSGSGGSGGTGGGSSLFNGCDPATAEDHTADAMVTIMFGGTVLGTNYSPKCIRVTAGTDITFAGNFMFHPLQGGTVVGTVATPDPMSPIIATTTGMSATFNLANPGDYGYYCTVHGSMVGMMGAIFVVP